MEKEKKYQFAGKYNIDFDRASLYGAILENSPDFVFLQHNEANIKTARFIDLNKVAIEKLEYEKDELLRLSPAEIAAPESILEINEMNAAIREKGRFSGDIILITKTGKRLNVEFESLNVKAGGGDFVVTEARIVPEDELSRENMLRMVNLVNTSDAAIISTNSLGIVQTWNKGAEKIFGYLSSEAISKPISIILSPEAPAKFQTIVEDIICGENIERFDKECKNILGRLVYVSLTISRISDSNSKIHGVSIIARNISDRKVAEDKLRESREKLRSLTKHIQKVREEERKRIAVEIHDQLGQALTALSLDLSWLKKKIKPSDEDVSQKIRQMHELIDHTSDAVCNITSRLRPSILDHFGLVSALEWQADDFSKRSGIRHELNVDPKEISPGEQVSVVVFRIFQELLTNIIRHSKADKAVFTLKEENNLLKLVVEDNGIGISEKEINAPGSFGLIGISERASTIGGSIRINGVSGRGTKVELLIPSGDYT